MLIGRGNFDGYRERIDCDRLDTCCRRAGALHEDVRCVRAAIDGLERRDGALASSI